MKKNEIKLPVDFNIMKSDNNSIESMADSFELKIKKSGYSLMGGIRLGLRSFLVDGEIFIPPEEIENRINELDGAGLLILKHFAKDFKQNIPEAWEDNLYFGISFEPKNPKDPKTKFLIYLTKINENFKPMFKQISGNFVPREKDKLVCIIY